MHADFLVYIGTFFGTMCYMNDFYSILEIFRTLNDSNRVLANKSVNIFSMRIRVFSMTANACFLTFYTINEIDSSMYCYLFVLSMDVAILITRMYLLWHYRKTTAMLETSDNPLHTSCV